MIPSRAQAESTGRSCAWPEAGFVGRGIDDGVDLGRFGLQDGGGAGDFHGLADLTDLHFNVDAGNLVEHQSKGRIGAVWNPSFSMRSS